MADIGASSPAASTRTDSSLASLLSSGSLAIVQHGGGYEVIPREAALKIQERDPRRVLLLSTQTEAPEAVDPYAAYQIPDDLMW